jgi:succinate dehydrogenase / fumarate reductase cytochrome b subunit
MASTPTDPRPLSPHVFAWRWHLTMWGSIVHRVTGVALYAGALVLVAWLAAIAGGPDAYAMVEGWLLSFLGRLVLFGFTLSATYHLANGIRHLFWDVGAGFDPGTATFTNVLVFLFTLVATLAIWAAAYGMGASA